MCVLYIYICMYIPYIYIPHTHGNPSHSTVVLPSNKKDALIWNLRSGGWPFSLVIQVPEEPGGIRGGVNGTLPKFNMAPEKLPSQ